MVLEISSVALRRIREAAHASPAIEICGLLLGTAGRVENVLPCDNVASDPHRTFEIDPVDLIAAHRAARNGGPQIVGCYHSHPDGPPEPSARDAASAAPDGSIWIIVAAGGTGVYRAVETGRYHGRFTSLAHRIVEG